MKKLDGDNILIAKHSFEHYAASYGVVIKAYRANNGRFADFRFKEYCICQHQALTLCSVRAHHQNDIVECVICNLNKNSRTSLLKGIYL